MESHSGLIYTDHSSGGYRKCVFVEDGKARELSETAGYVI